ncbi:hypothetical protein DK68_962 [Brucella suis]|nr:hypothetical protein C050_01906 [Brucella suis 92/63]ENR24615.1 hypothetical protein C978_03199 [Brucella suis 94/11]ENR39596.1 hypothetical protein C063_01995 [Brucella suis F8/06-2]ENT32446.1 hypothetical protein C039_02014 [Brucella suis 63/261]ENT37659.1 hypothetical protein C049_02031 [Brucella suis F12/02]ENT41865.1 hypothetical protein B986_02021 [Brucella suis F5/05-10]ENT42418.1 hypothetical protein B969_02027 [Brucella suis F5/05-4]ENT49008.1 hypothetical protein C000_02020 [Bru
MPPFCSSVYQGVSGDHVAETVHFFFRIGEAGDKAGKNLALADAAHFRMRRIPVVEYRTRIAQTVINRLLHDRENLVGFRFPGKAHLA